MQYFELVRNENGAITAITPIAGEVRHRVGGGYTQVIDGRPVAELADNEILVVGQSDQPGPDRPAEAQKDESDG